MREDAAVKSHALGSSSVNEPRWFENALMVFIGIHGMKALFQLFVAGPQSLAEGADVEINALPLRALWAFAYLGTFALCLRNLTAVYASARAAPVLGVILGWCVLSTSWSPEPALALQNATTLVLTALMGLYYGTRYSTDGILAITAWTLAIALVLSAFFIAVIPSWGTMQVVHHGAWSGVFIHKNGLGGASVLGVIVFGYMMGRATGNRRRAWLGLLVLSVLLAIGARSATALFALAAVALAFPLRGVIRLRGLDLMLALTVLTAVGLVAGIFFTASLHAIFSALGKDLTLTGRVELWKFALHSILARPIGGYGFDSFFLSPGPHGGLRLRLIIDWAAPHIHNSWLQIALDLGLVGLGLFIVFFGKIVMRALALARLTNAPAYRAITLILLSMVIYSVSETIFLKRNSENFFLLVALFVSLGRELLAVKAGITVEEEGASGAGRARLREAASKGGAQIAKIDR
jgi:O-antigen ligase